MTWDQTVAALLGGSWRANAYNPAAYQRKWAMERQYRYAAGLRPRAPSTRRQATFTGFGGPSPAPTVSKPTTRARSGFPERINLDLPYSWQTSQIQASPVPYQSTQGDLAASIGGTLGNVPSYLNLANVVPWAMERPLVGIKEIATNLTGDDENIVNKGVDALSGALISAAQPVAEVMDAPMNFVRDSLLSDRADTYRALVRGEKPLRRPDPRGITSYDRALWALAQASDGEERVRARTAANILADAIDLPPELKAAIRANPDLNDDQINKLLDKFGRQVSYQEGLPALFANAGLYLGGYAAETALTFGVGGAALGTARGAALGARTAADVPLTFGGLAKGAGALTKLGALGREAGFALQSAKFATPMQNALRFGAWAGRGIFQVQSYAMAAGLGYLSASLITEAALRTLGDEDGVAYLDRLNRSVLFSDDPAVQLVTSFTTDPIVAIRAAKAGTLAVVHRTGIPIGRKAGNRMVSLYENEDYLLDRLSKVWQVDRDAAPNMIGDEGFESVGQAWDSLIHLASDAATAKESPVRMLNAERWATELANEGATNAFISANFDRLLDIIDKHPEAITARLLHDWYDVRGHPGTFDPWKQVKIEVDYLHAAGLTQAARARVDAVQALPDALTPAAAQLARDYVGDLYAAGREVTIGDLQDFLIRYPGAHGMAVGRGRHVPYWEGLITGTEKATDTVERSVFEEIIRRAEARWDELNKRNPIRARTGHDPVLRPNSRMWNRDMADALGTTEDTIAAVYKNPGAWQAADRDLVSAFARDKGLVPEATILPDTELFSRVNEYVDRTTEAWVERGAAVEVVESQLAIVNAEIDSIRRTHAGAPPHAAIAPKLAERAQLLNLITDAMEPRTMFTEAVKFARPAAAAQRQVERAARILDAQERMGRIRAVLDQAQSFEWPSLPGRVVKPTKAQELAAAKPGAKPVKPVFKERREGLLSMLTDVGGAGGRFYVWNGGRPQVPQNILTRNRRYWVERGQVEKAVGYDSGETIPRMWQRLWQQTQGEGRSAYTAQQLRMIERYGQGGENIDEWVAAWSRGNEGEFMEWLKGLRGEYDDALQGGRLTDLMRTEAAKMPEWAETEAKAVLRDLFDNPEARVQQTLDRAAIKLALSSDDTFPTAAALIERDPEVMGQIERLARDVPVGDYIRDPANREAMLALMPDEPGAIPGVPAAETALDQACLAGDEAALAEWRTQLADLQGRIAHPARNVSPEAAEAVIREGRPSRNLERQVAAAGLSHQQVLAQDAWSRWEVAMRAASAIYRGNFTMPPETIGGLLRVLREIENGNVANAGMGTQLAAEVQRAARNIVTREIGDARKAGFEAGVIGMGKMLRPETWAQDTYEDLFELYGKGGHLAVMDDSGNLIYGLKQRPKDAVVIEMSTVPGLVEELLTERFVSLAERTKVAQVRQQFNAIFGPKHNQQIFYEASQRFTAQLENLGIPARASRAIWKAWGEASKGSREAVQMRTKEGFLRYVKGNNALYASTKNIPNGKLGEIAHEIIESDFPDLIETVRRIDIPEQFRLSTSFTRRHLAEVPTIGEGLQRMYGFVAHNAFVTTWYWQFRFGLDLRFRAMEANEGWMLYAGRAGARRQQIDEGLFGMTLQSMARAGDDAMLNTGMPFAIGREQWVYKTLLKEQPDAARKMISEDPELFQRAVRSAVENDPQLAEMCRLMGDTPDSYMAIMDRWHRKLFNSSDPEAFIDAELAKSLTATPELAEALGRIGEMNKALLDDIRACFYGNPNRTQIERFLNSYLLYWPLSYQIKAAKWMFHILLDRAGGLKTNAGGVWALDQVASAHMQLTAEDPEYSRFFEEHPTLVFVSQMLVPMTPTSLGVSLSPIGRNVLRTVAPSLPFLTPAQKEAWGGYSKSILEMGPIYSYNLGIREAGELYPDFASLPFAADIYQTFTGRKPPKPKKPEETLWQPEPDIWRGGG